MTTINQSSEAVGDQSRSYRRPYTVHREESLSELSRMNNLNTRFMNFLDTVKSETKRSELLTKTVLDKKQEIVGNLRTTNTGYYEQLMNTKKCLNEVTLALNSCQVNERSSRIRIEWFSNLLKFELENLNQRPKYNLALANSLNFQAQVNNGLEQTTTTTPTEVVAHAASTDLLNLSISTNSNMSSSQISLSSMSCSSSSANVSDGGLEDVIINVIIVLNQFILTLKWGCN
jgi:hypothetical protein